MTSITFGDSSLCACANWNTSIWM